MKRGTPVGVGVGPSEVAEGYDAFIEGKKVDIEGVYGKGETTLYLWMYLAGHQSMPQERIINLEVP